MTFPAELTFKRDPSLQPTARRVYDYLTTELDFVDVRLVKIQQHAERIATDRESFGRALDTLVVRGYLIEHDPIGNVRRFTLAWSVASQLSETPT